MLNKLPESKPVYRRDDYFFLVLPLLYLFPKAFFSSLASRLLTFLASSVGGRFSRTIPRSIIICIFRRNPEYVHHFPDSLIVVHMFRSNLSFTVQILLLYIDIGHFDYEVLCFNADGREEVGNGTIAGMSCRLFS